MAYSYVFSVASTATGCSVTIATGGNTYTATPGNSVSLSIAANTSVTVTATPGPGYGFTAWRWTQGQITTSNPWTFNSNDNWGLVAAEFGEATTVTCSASPSAGGSVSPSSGTGYSAGDRAYATGNYLQIGSDEGYYVATARSGYVFDHWTVNGTTVGSGGVALVSGANYVVAVFDSVSATVTLTKDPSASGSWSSTSGSGYSAGDRVYPATYSGGTAVQIGSDTGYYTFTCASGYQVDRVEVNGTTLTSSGVALVAGSNTITVYCSRSQITVRIYKGDWNYVGSYGSHSSSSTYLDVTQDYGTTYDVCWSRYSGSNQDTICDYWSTSWYGESSNDSITFDGSVTTVYPSYHMTHTITKSVSPTGTGTVSGDTTVYHGKSSTYTAAAGSGYAFDHWVVDGVNGGTNMSYTFSNVTGNHTIQAVFVEDTISVTLRVEPIPSESYGGTRSGYINLGAGGQQTHTFTNVIRGTVLSIASQTAAMGVLDDMEGGSGQIQCIPETAYNFYRFEDANGNALTNGTVLTDGMVIVAKFAIKQFTITPSVNESAYGSIDPSTVQNVDYGGSKTFTATPSSGYKFSHWIVDGSPVQE